MKIQYSAKFRFDPIGNGMPRLDTGSAIDRDRQFGEPQVLRPARLDVVCADHPLDALGGGLNTVTRLDLLIHQYRDGTGNDAIGNHGNDESYAEGHHGIDPCQPKVG